MRTNRVRTTVRFRGDPHARSVRAAGGAVGLHVVQTLHRADDGGRGRCRGARPGAVVRPFVGHDLSGANTCPSPTSRCGAATRGGCATWRPSTWGSTLTRVFEGKTLTLGGTCSKSGGIVVGDLSALLVERTSFGAAGSARRAARRHCWPISTRRSNVFCTVAVGAGDGLRRCPVVEPGAVAPHGGVHGGGCATCARIWPRMWNCSRTEAWGSNPTVRRSAN